MNEILGALKEQATTLEARSATWPAQRRLRETRAIADLSLALSNWAQFADVAMEPDGWIELTEGWPQEYCDTAAGVAILRVMLKTIRSAGLMGDLVSKAKENLGIADADVIEGPTGQIILASTLAEKLGMSEREVVDSLEEMGEHVGHLRGPAGVQ